MDINVSVDTGDIVLSFPSLTLDTLLTIRFVGNDVGTGDGSVDAYYAITPYSPKIRAKTRKKVKIPKEDSHAFSDFLFDL